ncbi:MAG: efflux RND transporter periplasmic adaptor subunit [Burkholderiales bacterium]|nr:efflux RND transporter periplasmic adaptor subunit [Burkholderiales bacterium]
MRSPRRQWHWLGIAVLASCVGGGVWALYPGNTTAEAKATKGKPNDQDVVYELAPADVAVVQSKELAFRLPLSGTLVPVSQATIRSKVAAEVAQTLVQEGMSVTKGQLLAQFAAADLRARLTTQDAAVDEARARLALAEKNRQSNAALLKQKYISQNAFDTTHNGVELAQASLKSAVSQREIAAIAVADTQIRSPIDGIISKRNVQAGDKVSPDSALFTIVSLAQLTLEAQIPSSEIPRVKAGQPVRFHVDGFDQREFEGTVARINPTAESGSRSMRIYISVNNQDGALKGGMFAKGYLMMQKTQASPVIPLTAIHHLNNGDVVFQISQNVVRQQPITLGLRNEEEGLAQVVQGLDAGMLVVASKLDVIKAGSRVQLPATLAPASATPAAAVKG